MTRMKRNFSSEHPETRKRDFEQEATPIDRERAERTETQDSKKEIFVRLVSFCSNPPPIQPCHVLVCVRSLFPLWSPVQSGLHGVRRAISPLSPPARDLSELPHVQFWMPCYRGYAANFSMGHQVEDDINRQRISAGLGKEFKIGFVLALAFPAIAQVGVMGGNDHY